jgi:hypothetical protein
VRDLKQSLSNASRRLFAQGGPVALVFALTLGGCTAAHIYYVDSDGGDEAGDDAGDDAGDQDGLSVDEGDGQDGDGSPDGGVEDGRGDAGPTDVHSDGVAADTGAGGTGGARPDAADGPGGADGNDAPTDTGASSDGDAPGSPDGNDDGPDASGDGPPGVLPTAAGQLVISEMMIDTDAVTDDDAEWFEIYNPSPTVTYDLNGCTLGSLGITKAIMQPVIIPPGGYATFGRNQDPSPSMLGFLPTYSYGATLKFSNSAGQAQVICGADGTTLIDSVTYTAAEVVKGRSHSLDPRYLSATANDNPANWCPCTTVYRTYLSVNDYGTPNAANHICPGLPDPDGGTD